MNDYRAAAEKLRKDSAEAALIRDRATDKAKRELFERLAAHFNSLAAQVEQALMEAGKSASRHEAGAVAGARRAEPRGKR